MVDEVATMPPATEIIRLLDLKPHPEGGHFRETFRDPRQVDGARAASTAAYYLLARGERSHWHKVDAVEAWLYHERTAQARDRRRREGTARVPDVGSRSHRRRAPAGDRAGARLAGRAKPGRVDAVELHGRARIRFQGLRPCAEGLGAAGLVRAIIPIGPRRLTPGEAADSSQRDKKL